MTEYTKPKDVHTELIRLTDDLSFPMHLIEGGTFDMGGTEYDDEQPIHEVSVSNFYLCPFQVTQEVYEFIMGNNPARFKGEKRPVENVSWDDTKEFFEKFKDKTGWKLRLPTEAEWEYAARGGNEKYSQGYKYSGSDDLKQVGWYYKNSGEETKPVGLLLPNELGLYDMSGNVYEWCKDWYDSETYKKREGKTVNPQRPEKGGYRVVRGGSYFRNAILCRPAYRSDASPDHRLNTIGFRVACSPPV